MSEETARNVARLEQVCERDETSVPLDITQIDYDEDPPAIHINLATTAN